MTSVFLTEEFSEEELERLRLFRKQFREFWDNFEDLRKTGLSLSSGFVLGPDGKVRNEQGSGLGVSRHRLKGFFLDYRLFHQDKEPIEFNRVVNLLKRRCRAKQFTDEIEKQARAWKEPEVPILGWHNKVSVIDLVDAVFNEKLFHIGEGRKTKFRLDEIREKMTDDVLMFAMVHTVYSRLLVLRNVNWVIVPVIEGHSFLRLPEI